jgi:hypothetical protein
LKATCTAAISLLALWGLPTRAQHTTETQASPPIAAGVRSAALTAVVTSIADSPVGKDATGHPLPAVAAGSGMATVGNWTYVAQDNSNMLAALGMEGATDVIRLFPPIDGADRFLKVLGNRKVKPDIEALVMIPAARDFASKLGVSKDDAKQGALFALASGSTAATHDRVALIYPNDVPARCRVIPILATGFYARMRAEQVVTSGSGAVTFEGAVMVNDGKAVRFFNRNKKGGHSTSIDVAAADLLDYLVRARKDPSVPFEAKLANPRQYDLGVSPLGTTITIGDATVIPGKLAGAPKTMAKDVIVISAAAEEEDDTVAGALLGVLIPDGTLLLAPLTGQENASGLKVEGLAVRSASWEGNGHQLHAKLRGVVDPDAADPAVPSPLVEMDLTFTLPEGAQAKDSKGH